MMIGEQVIQQDPYRVCALGDVDQRDDDIGKFRGLEAGDGFHPKIVDNAKPDVLVDGENAQLAFFQMPRVNVMVVEVGCHKLLHRLEAEGFQDRLCPWSARHRRPVIKWRKPPAWTLWTLFHHHLAISPP
jgi:hypothetical protein